MHDELTGRRHRYTQPSALAPAAYRPSGEKDIQPHGAEGKQVTANRADADKPAAVLAAIAVCESAQGSRWFAGGDGSRGHHDSRPV